MGVFEFKVGRKRPTSSELAKERLKVVLVHDRLKLNPELLEIIRDEILTVVSRRLAVDEKQMQVNVTRESGAEALFANMPIRREKVSFEWDPPSYNPASNAVVHGRIHMHDNTIAEDGSR
jgi:cell division topological specificity factor